MAVMRRGTCAVCGSDELITVAGLVRQHKQMRVNRRGEYRSKAQCPGSGEPPEPVVELPEAA